MEYNKLLGYVMSCKIGWNIIFEEDSTDDESDNESVPKNLNYFENTICRLNDQQFKGHFRILPTTFELLYEKICCMNNKFIKMKQGNPGVSLEKQMLMTLWYLANTECFRSVSDRFGVSINACWHSVFNISKEILKLNVEFKIIAWPSQETAERTADYFHSKTKFPGIIGCIDGSHIAIPAPKEYPNSYINRKKYHSVLLQAVCDENMHFIDCYAGEAGSIHDSCLFRRSKLFEKLSNGTIIIPPNQHLVGDLGYGIKPYLMTPCKDTGNITAQQSNYNKAHSSARITIERAFGLLKGRFRRLQGLNTKRPDLIPLIIMTACILHNVCLQSGDFFLFEDDVNADDGSSDPARISNDTIGNEKRNRIISYINTQ